MERIWSTTLDQHVGERVRLAGWLHRFRQLSQVNFLVLRDAKGLAQVVVEDPEVVRLLAQLHPESVLSIEGIAVAQPQAPGGVELHQPAVEIVSVAAEPPPFDLFRPMIAAQLPTILDHAPLALRHPRHRAYFALAAALVAGFRSTLRAMDFIEIHTPKLVASATEGGANVFPVDYFGRSAYLAQSPQFYKQLMVGVFERVFEVGPVFRAEPHDTPRHLNEYVSLDAEMGFITDHREVMMVLTRTLEGMLATAQEEAGDALALLRIGPPQVPEVIPAIHFTGAQALIAAATGEDLEGELDLAPAHERWLGDWARREHGSDFLFVVGYPLAKRPFYTHPDPERPAYSRGFDLLFRGLELVTGGQRLHRHEDYLAALAARRLDPAPFAGYLEAFKHGMPPHGGFAIGLERLVARLVGVENIRETTLFPRDLHRLDP
ncbi:MAG TPA: aspartate--tRNA(Asn) ligase [Gemmatimonadales bacterium]|nr:aspartate--tRNA(Asn) ligase [Gemmatimonadales bacterium]